MKAILLGVLLLLSNFTLAETRNISWEIPTLREDGSILLAEEIAGYDIAYSNGEVLERVVGTSYTVTLPSPGEYCFKGRTVDTGELVSDWSDVVCTTFKALPVTITIKITIE